MANSDNPRMAERVHPQDIESPPVSGEHPKASSSGGMHHPSLSQDSSMSGYSGPPSGTYVIQLPKDQIYRVPPPENAHKYKLYTTRRNRSSGCRRFCCITLGVFVLFIALLAVSAGVFYLVFHPKTPKFSVDHVSVSGVNITAKSDTISPVFNVTIKSVNGNGKIGVYYEPGSSITVNYYEVKLCEGALPVFYQPPKNTTVFSTKLDGGDIVLSSSDRTRLAGEQKKQSVPVKMTVEVPVKVKVGSLKLWKMTAKAKCTVVLNALTVNAKVVSKDCKISVKLW